MNAATERDHEFLAIFDRPQLQTWHHARFGNKGGKRTKDELARAITNGISWTTFLHDYVREVTDKQGRSAITIAAANGHDAIVTLLLGAGADPNLKDSPVRTCTGYGVWSRDAHVGHQWAIPPD